MTFPPFFPKPGAAGGAGLFLLSGRVVVIGQRDCPYRGPAPAGNLGERVQRPEETHERERRLVEAARAGDARAFERLLDLHASRVLRVVRLLGVRPDDREDVAQEVFVRALGHEAERR